MVDDVVVEGVGATREDLQLKNMSEEVRQCLRAFEVHVATLCRNVSAVTSSFLSLRQTEKIAVLKN